VDEIFGTHRFRESGFSKECRLDPQITIGLLTDQAGFPLMVHAFEGNMAETKTMLPVIAAFMSAHQLPDVTVVADAGMISAANQKAIEAAGCRLSSARASPTFPTWPQWRREHPGEEIPDGHIFTEPWPAGPGRKHRDQLHVGPGLPHPRQPRRDLASCVSPISLYEGRRLAHELRAADTTRAVRHAADQASVTSVTSRRRPAIVQIATDDARQRGQQCTVGGFEAWSRHLTSQHRESMAQDEESRRLWNNRCDRTAPIG